MILKVYLSVPIIVNRRRRLAKLVSRIVENMGHEVVSKWVLDESLHAENIFERDTNGVKASDLLIADVNLPSTGVGMEIMLAYLLGKPIIVFASYDRKVSRMLLHMDNIVIIRYKTVEELEKMLKREVRKFEKHGSKDRQGSYAYRAILSSN